MKIVKADRCSGCGPTGDLLAMLEFTNGKDVTRTLCADCVTSIAYVLGMNEFALRKFTARYTAAVLGTSVSVVSDDASS